MLYFLKFNCKMSRIGKQFISIPEGVDIKLTCEKSRVGGQTILVEGPKGKLSKTLPLLIFCVLDISWVTEDGRTISIQRIGKPYPDARKKLYIQKKTNSARARALVGLSRTLIANMVAGVSCGFEKKVRIVGVGYKAELTGNDLLLNVGYSHPVKMITPGGISVKVESPTMLVVSGVQKDEVGEFAAKVRAVRSPEPYKGKGIAYEGEIIRRKAGKTGK
jgi:large subunit ribosomal protein L6